MSEPFTAPSSAEDVKSYIENNDIEFLFAQFVDMHGKPNAKLVPARHFDGLMEDGAGFAGFAAGAIELADPLDRLDQPCYDMRGLTRNLDFMSQISRYVTDYGWNNYANDHEDANGQFEQNFDFADALTTADRAIFFRYMVESLAQERGLLATFMPKPFGHLTGNGCHFHMSLWKDGKNVFEVDDPSDDPRGLGLSELAYNFIGGLKKHAKAYIALTAPTVSSYKRLKQGTTTSGATWSPVYISYGYNNRTQMLRIPGPGRVEDRTIDGSCNPYLAATVVLAAGLDGIQNKLDPGEPNSENLYTVPIDQ